MGSTRPPWKTFATREEAEAYREGRILEVNPNAFGAQAARNSEVASTTHKTRMRAASAMAQILDRELDRIEATEMPDDQRLALLCTLEMMMSPRPTVAGKGREAYLRLKGLLLTKKDEAAARQERARKNIEGLM